MKKILLLTVVIVLLIVAGIGAFFLHLQHYAQSPASSKAADRIISIPAGQSFNQTTATLAKVGIIHHPYKFKIVARLKGYDKKLQAGEYILSATLSPVQILQKMVNGDVRLYRLTVPEGLNLYQIAELVEETGLASKSDFMAAATSAEFAHQLGLNADTFEGYLFPETYFFPKNVAVKTIISTMVDRFRQIFSPDWQKRAEQMGFSRHQIVILASIIEKETGAPFERPLISSVFHNRLNRNMRLESDPTVIYGLENFDGNLKRKHLEAPTPYNTYKRSGLPAGPIANPGKASLEAALYPADTKFMYFVSKKDHTHQFSTNFKDHQRAVQKYQLRRR
ncbi:MAG: endolytic transglycosylase MltG [Desulfobacterales bacterium]